MNFWVSAFIYKIFNNMTMEWNYITVPSFMFKCVTISELRLRVEEELSVGK